MGNDINLIHAWVRKAKRTARLSDRKLSDVLDDINDALIGDGVQNGQILVSTSEAGGSVSFALPPGHTPLELAILNEEAIKFCNHFNDPENPPLTGRRIQRLRASFWRARP